MANSDNGLPVAGLVTEDDVARITGLDVSQIRLMMSGNIPIPSHLQGVIPAPATQITGYVWNPDDLIGLEERMAEAKARQRREMAEQMRPTAPAPAPKVEPEVPSGPRVSESVFQFQAERERERADAEDRFGSDVDSLNDALLPVGPRKRDKPGWLRGLVSAWRSASAPKADAPADVTAEPANIDADDAQAFPAPTPATVIDADGNVVVTSGSNSSRTRRAERDALAAQKAELKAERDRALVERAEQRAAKKAERSERRKKPAKDEAATPSDADTSAPVDAPADDEVSGMTKADAKKYRREQAAAVKAAAKEKRKQKPLKEVLKAPKKSPEEKKAEAAAEKAAKKADKIAAKEAKAARDAAYKAAMERWKQDVKVAKDTGTRPPRKPKRPKNDTSKPKPIDVNNAVRALATMLENSPGELESIRVMAREYEGTQIGEAFRRIQHRISDQNASMVEAFAPEKVFPVEVHNMLAVGQKTIAPGPALRTAVKLMDAGNDARRKLKSEIMEPASVGALSLVALFATAYGVMPSFVEMYNSLDMEVPPVSAAILVMSDVTVWVLGGMFAAAVAYIIWWFAFGRRWDKWRTWLDAYSLHMPLMGQANMTQQTYQLLKILGAYINVGAPEREALVDAAAATKNRAIKKHLLTTAELMMAGRRTFAGTFEADLFPSMAKNILGIGEQAGRVPEAILDLERVYEREAEVATEQAVTRVSGTVAGISSLIFTVVVTMVTVPPLEMFGSTLSYGQ